MVNDRERSPTQDAVIAFCALVRAVREGDRAWQRRMIETLREGGFHVRIAPGCPVKHQP